MSRTSSTPPRAHRLGVRVRQRLRAVRWVRGHGGGTPREQRGRRGGLQGHFHGEAGLGRAGARGIQHGGRHLRAMNYDEQHIGEICAP